MKLVLIRHGETVFNREERMQGVRDIELSDDGRREAVELGKALRQEGILPRCVYTSPVKRARDTAHLLGFDVDVESVPGLRARGLGELEGLTKAQIRSQYPGAFEHLVHWDYYPPGGDECLRDLFHRAERDIGDLIRKEHEAGLVLGVTHSGVLEAVLRGWMRLSPDQKLPIPLKNAAAMIFENTAGPWTLVRQISAGHSGFSDGA